MNDWKKIAARMRGDLDRADLSGRARKVAETCIKMTLMQGRTRVVLPNKAELCRLIKVGENHWPEVIAELQGARIVRFTGVHEGWELLVFPDATGWSVDWDYTREQMATFLADLNRAPGQVQGELIEPAPSLARTLAEVSAKNADCGLRIADCKSGEGRTSHFGKSGVPVSGSRVAVPVKQLTGLTASSKQLTQLTVTEENRIIEDLKAFVGEDDVREWGGDWRKNWIRKQPEAFVQALKVLSDEAKQGWEARKSRAAALKDLTRRLAK